MDHKTSENEYYELLYINKSRARNVVLLHLCWVLQSSATLYNSNAVAYSLFSLYLSLDCCLYRP